MADQLGAGWLPAYGHPTVQAPQLDRLAREGVVFDAACCPSPLCAPSRAALMTGRLPSALGVYDNGAELRASEPTVAHRLRAAGYDTTLVGKMHFVGPDQLHGFEHRLTADVYPAGLEWTPDWRLGPGEQLPWYHTMESVLTPGPCVTSLQLDYDDEVAFRAVRRLHDLAREPTAEPWFMTVSFTHPHDPWELRASDWDRYDPAAIELPRVGPEAASDPHSRRLREMCGVDTVEPTDEQVRRARHGYYAAVSYVDARIGEVLAALRESGLAEDTVVLFTADHGELLGERGLWYKMAFFEAAARVPLIAWAPGRFAPGRVAEPVSLLDLAPTLCELAGEAEDDDGDGRSLAPVLRGEAGRGADVVAEYLAEGVRAPMVMVRRGRHKLIHCPGDPDLLFDLEADPDELVDLAADPGHAELLSELRAEVRRRWDLGALEAAVLASQRRRRRVVAGLHHGASATWDYTPPTTGRFVQGRDDLYALQRRARLEPPD